MDVDKVIGEMSAGRIKMTHREGIERESKTEWLGVCDVNYLGNYAVAEGPCFFGIEQDCLPSWSGIYGGESRCCWG
jgi:hypothetical protein